MPLTIISSSDSIELPRGTTAICIPLYGAFDLFTQCLESVLAHTDPHVPILVADDCSPGSDDVAGLIRSIMAAADDDRAIHYLRQPANVGFVKNVNTGFALLNPADVVILNSDVEVAEGWLDGMNAAAASDSRIASVSTLTNHGSILSLPDRNEPTGSLPDGLDLVEAAARVRAASLRLYPRIPVGIGHCLLVKRSALDLVGDFDLAFSPGYGEEVDLSLRCVERGLVHVVADDVFVFHKGGASFGGQGKRTQVQHDHDVMVNDRYPYFPEWAMGIVHQDRGPLARCLAIARRALVPLSVTIDGRCLGPIMTGTQLHALELIGSLHRTREVSLRVVLPPSAGSYARDALASMDGVEVIPEDAMLEAGATDVVHRPYQVGHEMELFHLAHLGRRLVVTFQDLISYNAPHYFPEYQRYDDYLRVTRDVFAAADRVLFFSPHAREEARRAGLITDDRTDVVLLGTDHAYVGDAIVPRRPEALNDSERSPFVLCLGTDFRHKNREFALQVFRELRGRHGWEGLLIFAGPNVSEGSSRGAEGRIISDDPLLGERVVDLGAVDEDEKVWLLEHASVVLYPTTIEGFGLVPFEAAAAGTPCVFAPVASLGDLFPVDLALLEPWNATAGADAIMRVVTDGAVAGALVAGILESGSRLRWDHAARGFINAYDAAIRDPRPASGDNVVRAILREQHALGLEQQMDEMGLAAGSHVGRGTQVDQALGDPDGLVPEEVKRATLAVASRRWLRAPVFGAIRLPYRLKGNGQSKRRAEDQ